MSLRLTHCGSLNAVNESTSLHGLKYITEHNKHGLERLFWIIVVTAFLLLGIFLTSRIVKKWQTSPIITTIETTHYPLTKVPFPAVTICPNYKGIKGKVATEICNRKWLKELSKNKFHTPIIYLHILIGLRKLK